MTISHLLQQGKERLAAAGIENADGDAWCLLEFVTGISKTWYLCNREQICSEEQKKQYKELIEKRASCIPLQYLTGEQVFMGLSFMVNSDVLIPRQDTEVLVEEVLKKAEDGWKVLDMCTGSGCILLSLAHFCRLKRAVGADLQKEALEVAKQNEKRLKDKLRLEEYSAEWICSDLFAQIKGKFDCIVSNPPYIPTAVIAKLAEEVKGHEPYLALDGGEDGLSFYRRLIKEAGNYFYPGGFLCLEIGFDQGEMVEVLLRENGFSEIERKKDLAGLDRVCMGRWNPI